MKLVTRRNLFQREELWCIKLSLFVSNGQYILVIQMTEGEDVPIEIGRQA